MEKVKRVKAALQGEEVDRVPISVWMHYPSVDQDAKMLAKRQVLFQKKFDLDFIKLMPFGLYSAQDWGCQVKFFCDEIRSPVVAEHGIESEADWGELKPLSAEFGNWGQQLQLTQYMKEWGDSEVPFVQTIFSPLTTAYKLAGDRLFSDIKTEPKLVHHALEIITQTTKESVARNIEAGAAGIFFATQCATYDMLDDEMYQEFGIRYDLPVIKESNRQGGWFNILHIHGDRVMFSKLKDYPVQALNWHDRQVKPDLQRAREMTDKCLIGGLDEQGPISQGTSEEVTEQVVKTIREAKKQKLMIGPGCVAFPNTPEENIYAARLAVETSGR